MTTITSADNPRFRELFKLRQSGRERRKSGLALLEGVHLVEACHQHRGPPEQLIINEDDAELRVDIANTAAHLLDDLEPFTHARKGNPNAAAHIFSALAGASLTLAVEGGRLALGTYQNVLLIELDGPKTRELTVQLWAL